MSDKHPNLWSKFHHLWSKAVGSPGYDKGEWLDLERMFLHVLSEYDKDYDQRFIDAQAAANIRSLT